MNEEWGSLGGDRNAVAIIKERDKGRRGLDVAGIANFLYVVGCGAWYAYTGSHIALALEILAAAWLAVSGVRREIYKAHTTLLVAEQRIRSVEQELRSFRPVS